MTNEADTQDRLAQLRQFRQELYQLLPARRDALLDLLDALCSSPQARSVVELSLSPLFRQEYGSVSAAITHFFQARRPARAQRERRVWDRKVARLIGRFRRRPNSGRSGSWGPMWCPCPGRVPRRWQTRRMSTSRTRWQATSQSPSGTPTPSWPICPRRPRRGRRRGWCRS